MAQDTSLILLSKRNSVLYYSSQNDLKHIITAEDFGAHLFPAENVD